jgi:hypothetical protein
MAKLFNNIRKKLINDTPSSTRTTNYLKYAIGEIVLVVIGILIALSINNWNENRKEANKLKVLTENLHNEFKTNLEELEVDLNRLKGKISAGNALKSYTGIETVEISEFKVDSLLFEAFSSPTWNPSTFTLNDIKNSGKLSDIKNTQLKLLLYQWERLYEDIIEWQNALTSSLDGPLAVLKRKGSVVNMDFYNQDNKHKSKFDIKNSNLLHEILFENELENNLYSARELEIRYNEAKILLLDIINQSKSDAID